MGLFDSLIPNLSNSVTSNFSTAIGNGVQKVTDFASASPWLKKAEAVGNLDQKGMLGQFTGVAPGLGVKTENDKTVVYNPETNEEIASKPVSVVQTASASAWETSNEDRTKEFKVVIYQEPVVYPSTFADGYIAGELTLDVMPTISESRAATYRPFSPLHHPGEILKYENTQSRTWSISARLVARNSKEATLNLQYINMIRSWVMPFYGVGTGNSDLKDKLGAPPPILTLKAYGKQMIGPVKCILENYDWQFPNDCDYLPTDTGIPFPVILQITLTLKESWSPAEYSSFSLNDYRDGKMEEAFGGTTTGSGGGSGGQQPSGDLLPAANSIDPSTAVNVDAGTAASSAGIVGIRDGVGASIKNAEKAIASQAAQISTGGRDAMDNFTGGE